MGIFGEGFGISGISSQLPSLQLLFKKRFLESLDRNLFPFPPLTEQSPEPLYPSPSPSSQLHTTYEQLSSLYVTKHPALYMWFLQARCGLLFTIINHNHNKFNRLPLSVASLTEQRKFKQLFFLFILFSPQYGLVWALCPLPINKYIQIHETFGCY